MLLACTCGKLYKVRDDVEPSEQKCRVCGGMLRLAGAVVPSPQSMGGAGPKSDLGPRVRDLEARLQQRERELDEARQRLVQLEGAPADAKGDGMAPAAAESLELNAARAEQQRMGQALADRVDELRAAAERGDKLERELLELRSETERELRDKERQLAEAREALERRTAEHERAVDERKAGATAPPLAENLERERGTVRTNEQRVAQTIADRVNDLRAAAERSDKLERELLELRSGTERELKDRDRQLTEAREALERETAERRRHEARLLAIEQTLTNVIEEKQKTIEALDASVASYRSKVEALQNRLLDRDLQRRADLETQDKRLREQEEAARAAMREVEEQHQRVLADLRSETEEKLTEKDRLISQGRQDMDREAGDRRRLQEALARHQESSARTVAEKDQAMEVLHASLASYRTKVEVLQARVNDLEQLFRAEQDSYATRLRMHEAVEARTTGAAYLASDLDYSLDTMEALLSGLRDRVRRLKADLNGPEPGAAARRAASPAADAAPGMAASPSAADAAMSTDRMAYQEAPVAGASNGG